MKKPTFSKAALAVLFLLLSFASFAQTYKPFSIRKNIEIRGKMLVVGNNILGKDNNDFNVDTKSNQDIDMKYIDIDGDAATFSSSSADLSVPNQTNGSPTTCYRVAYAALYWGAVLQSGSRTDINKIKLKLPGATTYNDITGQVVYDAVVSPIIPDSNKPYACFADVTNLLSGLPNLTGTYTVANVTSSEGSNGSTGLSAGWTLFVVYEDPSLHMKSFTVFDGFSHVYSSHFEKIPVTGFITPPSGPIDVQFAYAALDGDKPQGATKLEFGTKQVVTPFRPANNFFISTIENTNGVSSPRVPNSSNTLGYDTGVLEVIGADPEYINNNQTSTDFTLQVAKGQADPVFVFFSAYAVDIIAPKIDLTKIVKNSSGTDIGGGNVDLGQYLTYEISYRNVGNDNVTNFTIKDVLPINVTFNPATDIDYTNAGGATLQSYDPLTRTLIFKIPDTSVLVNGGLYTIRLNVRVATDCNSLDTACSNEIKNQAFATYQGVINPKVVQEEGSFASTACKLGSPESTNFLVDISKCKFTQNVIFCGSSVVLKASDGYSNYSWSRNADGSSPIGTGQTFTATQIGTYYVHNTAPATCKDIVEEITVKYFGVTNTNPVISFADQVVQCSNDGKLLPNIFLCGANATRSIKTGISDAASIVWEKLDEATCPSTAIANCANENFASTCWNQVGTGPDYLANTSGQFRVTLRYTGGCFSVFYFNVYQNLLNPTFTKKDIICGTSGEIIIGGVPTGYEYSIDGTNYQLNDPKFIINSAGAYTVYIKQQGVTTNPCIFTVPNILINERDLNVRTFVTQPSCHGVSDGSIKLIAENVESEYYFSIYQGTTEINSVGPIPANEYTFDNLSPGDYTVNVSTKPIVCAYTGSIKIIDPTLLEAKVNLSKALTCTDGELTINTLGGTANYNYYVNGIDVLLNTALTTITVPVPTAGKYDIKVVDVNNCEAIDTITVAAILPPVYSVDPTNILCYGSNTGVIQFTVTNDNGYTLMYSIDNGATYSASPTFSGLVANTVYTPMIKYSLNGVDCFDTKPTITLTEPVAALTASGGVSELAGCDPSGSGFGKVRITNPQGGTPFTGPDPYLYSFDNQGTWVATNEAYVAPGTYTLYIKDANGCIFPMPGIILEEKPVAPTIAVSPPVFNCDGTANSTVTVTNSGSNSFSYTYLLDGNPNPNTADPKTFLNVPTGSHTISVGYLLTSVPTYSNLLNEDFGSGAPTTTSGIAAAYCFNDQRVNPPYLCKFPNGTPSRSVEDNAYSVASFFWRSDDPLGNNTGAWYHFKDHTVFNPAVTDGRYLLVNIGSAAGPYGVLYSKPINNVIPNQPLIVDLYLGNLIRSSRSGVDPDFIIEIVDSSGNLITPGQATGAIPKNEIWNKKSLSFNPGANTSLTFKIRSGSIAYSGNDAVIDDIKVYQLPKACITKVDFPFEVTSGTKFSASVTGSKDIKCAGESNGEITIAAQNFDTTAGFQYSKDGITWYTSTTSPVTLSNLGAGTYTPQVRYNAAGACALTLTPQTINAPTPIVVRATATLATCFTGATVDATTTTGGTPAYSIQLIDAVAPFTVTNFPSTGILNNVAPGTYVVKVTDANGCTANKAPNLVIAPTANPTAIIDPTSNLCFDPSTGANIVVKVTGGVGPYTYKTTFNGGTPSASSPTFDGPTFTYNATVTGTYAFEVTDSFGCKAITADQIINDKLTAGTKVTKPLDCSASPDAIIEVTLAGGTSPFTYTVKNSLGTVLFSSGSVVGPIFTYSTGVNDTYTFDIKDSKGCVTAISQKVDAKITTNGKATVTNETCNTANDGSVTLEALTGVAPYTYSFNSSGFTATTTYGPLTGSVAGTSYAYEIKGGNDCIYSGTAIVFEPVSISGNANVTTAYTCSSNAEITVSGVMGGNGSFTYTLNRNGVAVASQTTLVFSNITVAGNYTVTITDSNGCSFTTPVMTVVVLNPPLNPTFVERPISCKPLELTSEVTVSITAGTGTGALKYETIAPSQMIILQQTSSTLTGLTPGSYTIKVTDANNCYVTGVYTVNDVLPVIVNGSLVSNVSCLGSLDGKLTYTVSGNSGAFTYVLTNSSAAVVPIAQSTQTGNVIDYIGLAADTYTLTITNPTTTCKATKALTVAPPAQALAITAPTTITPITCLSNATVFINTTGGWGSNSYTVTGPAPAVTAVTQSSKTFTGLAAGDYTASVTDLNGCTVSIPFTIAPVVGVVASIDSLSDFCFDSTDKATLVVSPNTFANYEYSINSGTPKADGTFVNLTPGSYTIRVTDTSTGCFKDLSATISSQVSAITAITKNLDCTASPDATIKVTIGNGYPDYSYRVSTNGGGYSGLPIPLGASVTTFNYTTTTGAAAATYDFEITDAKGCIIIVSQSISARVSPTATTTPTNPTCFGGTNGSIVINASLGLAPYTYEVSTDGIVFSPMASNSYTNASAGNYWFRVTDDKKCTFITLQETLTAPSQIIASAVATPLTCNSSNVQQAALITVSASNGTPFPGLDSYRYSFNGAAYGISKTFAPNAAGIVTIDVKDANGCILPLSDVTIVPLNPPTAITFSKNRTINCNVLDSDVELTVTGGTPLYTYQITAPAAATTTVANEVSPYSFLNLTPRVYTFKVTDTNGCSVIDTYNLTASGKINVSGTLVADASCNGATDGKIQFTVGGTYVGATGVLTNSLTAAVVNVPAIPVGGNVLNFTGLPAADYTLTVTNPSTGCEDFATVKVIEPTAVTITSTTPTKVFCSKPISTITVDANGGTSPLEYAVVKHLVIPLPGDYQSSNVFTKDTSLAANGLDYDVYVKDANGCAATMGTVSVVSDAAPTVTASGSGCLGSVGGYTIIATPGASVFGTPTYSLNGAGFVSTNAFTITTAGNYTITIKDGNGCTATSNIVTVASKLTLSSFLDKDITCTSVAPFTNDAQITLTAGGGITAYSYQVSLNGGPFSAPTVTDPYSFSGNIFTTSLAGNYQFEVKDSNVPSCTNVTTIAVVVTDKVDPVITSVTVDPLKIIRCNGDATATIDIVIDNTKGTSPFVFKVERTAPSYINYGTQTSGLTAGDYTVTVTDAKGCTDTEDITISEPKPIVVIHHELPITCGALGVSKGSIIIDKITDGISAVGGTGGTGPYNYFVTGVNGYSASELNNAGTTSITFNVVDFGLYQINVVDANGCSKLVQNVLVASPPDDLDINVISPPVDCSAKGSALISIGASPPGNITGIGPFHFAVYTGPGMTYTGPTALPWYDEDGLGSKKTTIPNLLPGVKYTFIVHDQGSGCYYYETSTLAINTFSLIDITPLKANNITCKGAANGNVSFTITNPYGVPTPVKYQIYNSQTVALVGAIVTDIVPIAGLKVDNFGNLPFGNYFVLVTEDTGATHAGCSKASASFDITEAAFDLTIDATVSKQPNTCDLTAGIITAIASGGKVVLVDPTDPTIIPIPYLYQIFPDTGAVNVIDGTDEIPDSLLNPTFSATFTASMTSNTFINKSQGNYIVYVKDAYGCIKVVFVSLVNDAPPTITPQTPPCFVAGMTINLDLSTFTASTIGTPTYSINGTSFQSSPNFTISAPGSYTLAIKDGNGCIASAPYVVRDEITLGLSVTKQLDCTVTPNASITLSAAGGVGTYTYEASTNGGVIYAAPGVGFGVGVTANVYSAVAAGTYTFRVSDGTCSVTNSIIVDPKVSTIFVATPTDVKCSGGNTGKIVVDITSGDGTSFEYKLDGTDIDGIVTRAYQTSNVFDLLKAGTYTVTVRNSKLCENVITGLIVGEPSQLAVNLPTIIKLSCGAGNAAQAATVTLNATAGTGTGPYKYSFNDSAYGTANIFEVFDTGLDQLGIPYKVKDNNNCEVTGTVDIYTLDPPVFNLTSTFTQTAVTCLVGTSTVEVFSTKGIGTITYSILAPASATGNISGASSGIFTGLAPGDYTFLVKDENNCTDQVSYRVNDVTKIDLQVTSQSDVVCDASSTGTASFAVTGFGTGVGTYRYQVNALPVVTGQTGGTISLTGLAANTYIVRVTDDETGCFDEKTVIINNPTIPFSSSNTVTPLGCITKGAVTINAVGGWGNNTYTLTQPDLSPVTNTTGVFGGLTQIGTYNTSVKDDNGCTITGSFSLLNPALVNPTISSVVVSCPTNNLSTLTVTAASASTFTYAPFEYSIDNGVTFQLSNIFNNLSPGSYDVVVKDAFGCVSAVTNTKIESQFFATAVKTKELDCTATPDGTIRITPTGGYSPYTYRVSINGAAYVAIPVANVAYTDYTVPSGASYVFEITDSKGCQFTTTPPVVMTDFTPVDVILTNITTTPIDCNGTQGTNNNGTITVNLNPLNNNPSYTYALSGTEIRAAQSSNVFTGLAPGSYDVTVTSGRGCTATVNVAIANPAVVTASASAAAFSCSPTNTINSTVVTVIGGGGTGAGTYNYSADGVNYFATNTFDVIDTGAPQNIDYYVKDANGCVAKTIAPVTINPFPKLMSVIATKGPAMDCVNNKQEMNVVISGGSNSPNPFTYKVYQDGVLIQGPTSVVGTAFTYDAPTAGHYYEFEVIDNNTMCSLKSTSYNVPVFNTIKVTATTAANVTCNGLSTGRIEINITGYSGNYDYVVYDGATPVAGASGSHDTAISNPFVIPVGLGDGTNYTVRVLETDLPNCPATSNVVVITEPAILTLSSAITVVNKNCFTTGAQITVPITSIGGGTPGFTYAFVSAGTPVTPGDFKPSNTITLSTTKVGPITALPTSFDAWDVYVQDANGCSAVQTIQITTDPMPTVTATVVSQCANPAGYTVNVVGSGVGTLEYSLDGNSFQTSTVFTVTSPGTYDVTVRDANQCTVTATAAFTILKPLALQGVVSKVRSCSALPDGEITVTASDGSGLPNYEYSIDAGAYGPSNVFSGLAAGTYTMNVRDTGTPLPLCVKSIQVIIDTPTLVTGMALSKVDVSCNGSSDGSIIVALAPSTLTVNNNPDYNFSLTGTTVNLVAVSRPNQLSNVFDALEAGTYTVTTTSSRGCQDLKTITVGEPNLVIVPAPTVVPFGCNAGTNDTNLATITVTGVTGGSAVAGVYANYQFIKTVGATSTEVYFGPSNVYTESDFTGGNYTVNVYDSKGCMGTANAIIVPFISIKDPVVAVDKPITCVAGEDITVSVNMSSPVALLYSLEYVNGGAVGYTYSIINQSTGVFTGLAVGNYSITVTNPTTGCSVKTVHYVNEPNTFDLTIDNVVDVTCFDATDGSARITFIDRVISATDPNQAGSFDYTIVDASGNTIVALTNSPTAGPITITGLVSGIYTVTATLSDINSPMCSVTKNFTISRPAIQLGIAETHTPITCATGDGTISASATGGWPGGYEFQLELTGTTTAVRPWSTVANFTGLAAGNYTVRVRDSKLCSSVTVDVSLVDPTPIAATIVSDKTSLTCFGNKDATINVTSATGGSGNYLYTLETINPDGTVTKNGPQQSTVFSGLGAGNYQVRVSDNWSCSNPSNTITIVEPTEVTPSLVLTSRLMCTAPATLTLSVSGGTPPYTYSADGTTYGISFASSVPMSVLSGTYHFYVKDLNGCVSYLSNDIKIDPLAPLTINLEKENPVINCAGDNTGVIVATAQGGLGNYVYTLTNVTTGVVLAPQPTGNFAGLFKGDYKIHVDSEDCIADRFVTITEPDAVLTVVFDSVPVTCNGNNDGKIVITASGGTGIIKYAISPRLDQFFVGNSIGGHSFNNLTPGTYDVMAQDENGCFHKETLVITEPNAILISTVANSIVPEICVGDNNGEFKIDISGGIAPYNVNLDTQNGTTAIKGSIGQTQFHFFNGIKGGDHTVYITDSMGCLAEWKVALPPAINLDPKAIVAYDCVDNAPGNTVVVTVDPSNTVLSDIDYAIDGLTPFQASNVFVNVAPGLHYVEARHTNGCTQKFDGIVVDKVDPLSISLALGGLNEIVATVSGGSGIYQFTLNGEQFSTQNKFIYFKSGNYTVTVTDSNGCVVSATMYFEFIDIEIPKVFTPNGSGTNDHWRPLRTENYPDIQFIVYDRYGRAVGKFGAGQFWDGNYNGTELPMGDYWYILKLNHTKDDREFVGHFTLYR
jgi:gliding motility-associated-like protein